MNATQREFRACFSKALNQFSSFPHFKSQRDYDGFLELLETHRIDDSIAIAAGACAHFILRHGGHMDQIALVGVMSYLNVAVGEPPGFDRNDFIRVMLSTIPATARDYMHVIRDHYCCGPSDAATD
jgi:hypothetical protein